MTLKQSSLISYAFYYYYYYFLYKDQFTLKTKYKIYKTKLFWASETITRKKEAEKRNKHGLLVHELLHLLLLESSWTSSFQKTLPTTECLGLNCTIFQLSCFPLDPIAYRQRFESPSGIILGNSMLVGCC